MNAPQKNTIATAIDALTAEQHAAAKAAAADSKAAALASARKKLRDLLTDDEIAALLGE